jgi:hypothetical protein
MSRDPARLAALAARVAPRVAPGLAAGLGALAGLAAPALACPYCSLSQGRDTLFYIAAFILVPYVIVSGAIAWIRHLLASERES